MDAVLDHVLSALTRTGWQLAMAFGGVGALALLMWCASTLLRREGSGLLGTLYYYIVAPGVICHETGHALGCIVTGSKIVKFVPFHPQGDTLGYVTHEQRSGVLGWFAEFLIATGPVWFACALVPALACIFAGIEFLPNFCDHMSGRSSGLASYVLGVSDAAWGMACGLFKAGSWKSPWFALALYLVFCITSEATLSGSDLKSAWKGFAGVVLVLLALNMVPVVGESITWGVSMLMPWLFPIHAIMAFVLLADLAFFAVAFVLHRVFSLFFRRRS